MTTRNLLLALVLAFLLVAMYFLQRRAGATSTMAALGRPRHPGVYLLAVAAILIVVYGF